MTKENRKRNLSEELKRAEQVHAEFVLLFDNGHFNGAVSRLYYYLLRHRRALLLTKGLEPRSHEAALRLFGQHYVKEGTFPTEASHLFARLMKYREEVDDNPSYDFSAADAGALKEEVEGLARRVRSLLEESGFRQE
jgi:uncharacterized protein (UPF0332 family)